MCEFERARIVTFLKKLHLIIKTSTPIHTHTQILQLKLKFFLNCVKKWKKIQMDM